MATKEIERNTHIAAHVSVIVYHVLIGLLIILTRYYDRILNINSRTLILILGVLLIVTSLLGLIPVLNKYDQIIIE
jgi:hypothetical protein